MTTLATKYDELKARREALKAEMAETSKALFREAAEELFAAHPLLQSFVWTQYTPYFNDGDVCVFGAQTDYPYISIAADPAPLDGDAPYEASAEGDEDGESYEEPYEQINGKYKRVGPRNAYERAGEAVKEFLGHFDDDAYLDMFGDHVKVMVRRDGVDVEEYSHD